MSENFGDVSSGLLPVLSFSGLFRAALSLFSIFFRAVCSVLSWALCPCGRLLGLAGLRPLPLEAPGSVAFGCCASFPLPGPFPAFLLRFPALFLFFLSPCLSVSLFLRHSVCRSVSLSLTLSFSLPLCLLSLTSAFPRRSWCPSVSCLVSFPLLCVVPFVTFFSFPALLCLCLSVSRSSPFVPSDPQTRRSKKHLYGPIGCFLPP